LAEIYLAGVSVRRIEDITEALWSTRVSPSTVSKLNQKIYARIETWRNWVVVEAELALRGAERIAFRGDRSKQRGISQSVGGSGGIGRGQGQLDGVSAAFERALTPCLGLFVSDKCLGLAESLREFIRERCGVRYTLH
jgi:putative transposase